MRWEESGNGGLGWAAPILESITWDQAGWRNRKALEFLLKRSLGSALRKKTSGRQGQLMELHCVVMVGGGGEVATQRECFCHKILPASHLWPRQMLLLSDQCFPCYLGANVSGRAQSDIGIITCSSELQPRCPNCVPSRAASIVLAWK